MRFLKEKGGRLTAFLGEILIGVLLIVEPIKFTSVVIIAAGVLMCVVAAMNIVRYFKADALAAAVSKSLYKGLAFAFFGLFCVFGSGWFIDTFPIISIVYGVCILLAGLSKVQWTVDALRLKEGSWIAYAVGAAVTVICAVVILINPFASVKVLWTFAGISLIAEAAMDIAAMFIKGKEQPESIVVSAEGVSADETEA